MSDFYSSYKRAAEEKAARQSNGQDNTFTKIGYFGTTKDASGNKVRYMTNSGDSALVRINYGNDPNELLGERFGLHPAGEGVRIQGRPFQKVACLGKDKCPICAAIANGNKSFGKATQRVFIPMVISYKLPDGTYTQPEPVVMDAASYMVDILVNTMGDFGPLRDFIFKLTRNGVGTDTRYSLAFIPTFNNENIITKASLSAFNNFDVSRHSYWVKSAEDMNIFLETGAFPEVVRASNNSAEFTASTAPAPADPFSSSPSVTETVNKSQPIIETVPTFEAHQPAANPTREVTKDYDFSAN